MWEWLRRRIEQMPTARSIGARGERIAETYLVRTKRYSLIARNWRSPHDQRDEIDLVMRDGHVLVFIEVKTRSADALVTGYHAVDRRKKQALRRGADAYLRALPRSDRPITFRFDVVEVSTAPMPEQAEVRHFENVPLFPKHYWP
jgi:putative endonuclease